MEISERYQRGLETLCQLYSKQNADYFISKTDALSPDLSKWLVEFALGEVYSRPHLDLKQRHLITLAVLTALGNTELQLNLQIKNALNLGFSETEITEAILHCVIWTGFPRVVNAMTVAQQVFAQYKESQPC